MSGSQTADSGGTPELGHWDVFPYGSGESGLSQDQKAARKPDQLFDPRRMKRRCAGCHQIIEGRPNRKYCSPACTERARYHRQKSQKKSWDFSKAVKSVAEGSNGKLIAQAARLGYLGRPDDLVLDVTPGREKWWTRYRPPNLVGLRCDFRELPARDDSVPVVIYDPPYISTGSRKTSSVDDFYDRYGLGDLAGWRAVRVLMGDGFAECARILKPEGHLLMKCMDYVESGRKVWNTFHFALLGQALDLRLVDRFHHHSGGGPQPMNNLDGSPREQKTAREVSSMLLVFTK